NRAADGALDHALAARYAAADVEAPHGRTRNCQRSSGAGDPQAQNARVDGLNRAAQELPVIRSLILAIRLRNPDTDSRSSLDFGGELPLGESRYNEQHRCDEEKTHHFSFFGGVAGSFSARSFSLKRCASPIRSTSSAIASTDCWR